MLNKNENKPDGPSPDHPSGHGTNKALLYGIVGAIFLGALFGGLMPKMAIHVGVLGEIFLRALMMIVVPLVMLSMIVGITGLGDVRRVGSIGWRTMVYYMVTTGLSVLLGLLMVNIIQPGKGISPGEKHPDWTYTITPDDPRTVRISRPWERLRFEEYKDKYALILQDQDVRGMITSIGRDSATVKFWERRKAKDVIYVRAEDGSRLPFRRIKGRLVSAEPTVAITGKGIEVGLMLTQHVLSKEEKSAWNTIQEVLVGMIPRNIFHAMAETDVLSLIFFSLILGGALSVLGTKGRVVIEWVSVLNDAVMRLVLWIMYFAPLGIFGLVAVRIGKAGGFSGFVPELVALGKYSLTVLLGLAIHGIIVLPLILWIWGRYRPLAFARGMAAALLNAFSTASSSATLPLTMEGIQVENGISNRTASFVLPLGATINMDGTALYEAVAAIFIAQVYGIQLDFMQQFVIFLTATLAAIGAAGIPEAGLVTMLIVLKAVGLPLEGIGILLSIDWLLDRFRTTINVWGDCVGAGVIETLEKKNAPAAPPLATEEKK